MMNQPKNKLELGVCLSEWDKNMHFDFDCMENMKESFCMLRIGTINCANGTFYLDKCFKEYAQTCNKLSIPWLGYVYLHYHTDNPQNKIFSPSYDVWNIFEDIPLSLPYIVTLFDFDLPNFGIDRLDDTVHLLSRAISKSVDKPFTMCVGLIGKCRKLANHSEFSYPLYVETLVPSESFTISVPNNTILCWYLVDSGESRGFPSYLYSVDNSDNKININQTCVRLDSVMAIRELAEAVRNYRGSV